MDVDKRTAEFFAASGEPLSIGVLVLNYNTWDIALRALEAAVELEPSAVHEYVLFDDGSPSPPPEVINPRFRVIRNETNTGFARALNLAFAQMKSDIVVLFDSDAYPLTPFAATVRQAFMADATLGQLGFIALDSNGAPTESFLGEPTNWSLILGQAAYARFCASAPKPESLCVITGCMATRLKAFTAVSGFDPELNFLDVDLDYSMRMRRGGWKVMVEYSIKVFHEGGGTPQLQRNRVLSFYKSRWYVLRKHQLIRHVRVARGIVLLRLRTEKTILSLFGRFLFKNPEILQDKLIGRRAIIQYCQQNYR